MQLYRWYCPSGLLQKRRPEVFLLSVELGGILKEIRNPKCNLNYFDSLVAGVCNVSNLLVVPFERLIVA